jgi:hypothetical protein
MNQLKQIMLMKKINIELLEVDYENIQYKKQIVEDYRLK